MKPTLYLSHPKITICLLEKPGLAGVYVNGWVSTGSKDDPSSLPGLAHLLEHLHVDEVARALRELLPEVRYSAWTDKEYTYYWAQSSKENLEKALAVLEKCFSPLLASQVQMDESLQHIASEVRQNGRDPWLQLHRQWNQLVFSNTTNYARSTWGDPALLEGQSVTDVVKYGNDIYESAAKSIFIVGSDVSYIERIVETWVHRFISYSLKSEKSKIHRFGSRSTSVVDVQNMQNAKSLSYLAWGFRLPSYLQKKRYLVELLECILAVGWDARLAEFYQGRERITYSIKSSIHWYKSIGSWKMQAAFRPEDVYMVKQKIEHHYNNLASQVISQDELIRAKNVLLTRLALKSDDPEFLARWYGSQLVRQVKKLETILEYKEKIHKVTVADLHECMRVILANKIYASC